MLSRTKKIVIQFGFYLMASFAAAALGYYIVEAIQPDNEVFGSLYRMPSYHRRYPLSYIFIPCTVYSLIMAISGSQAVYKSVRRQIMLTAAIIFLTLLFSFPLGGMLYYYHDMQAGYFPDDWLLKVINEGTLKGFEGGWLIIAFSFPYNLLGIVVCYFITKAGSRVFHKKQPEPAL